MPIGYKRQRQLQVVLAWKRRWRQSWLRRPPWSRSPPWTVDTSQAGTTSLGQQRQKHQRPCRERRMKKVTITEGTAEVEQLGRNPDYRNNSGLLRGDNAYCGVGAMVSPPWRHTSPWPFPLKLYCWLTPFPPKNGESGRGRTVIIIIICFSII